MSRLSPVSAAALCGMALLMSPEFAWAQTLGGAKETDIPVWRVIGAFMLCAGLAVAAAYALKTRLRGATPVFSRTERRLELVETVRLSHQVDVCLMRCDGREFIVAASPHGAVFQPPVEATAKPRTRSKRSADEPTA